jgi:predicted DNA-binding WGR domain protein
MIKRTELRNEKNGSHKYYIIELHQHGSQYRVLTKWGRIGRTPRETDKGTYPDFEKANEVYQDIVLNKTLRGYETFDNEPPPAAPAMPVQITVWSKKTIDANPAAFAEALRTALKGA